MPGRAPAPPGPPAGARRRALPDGSGAWAEKVIRPTLYCAGPRLYDAALSSCRGRVDGETGRSGSPDS
jgi:hypothetical protein